MTMIEKILRVLCSLDMAEWGALALGAVATMFGVWFSWVTRHIGDDPWPNTLLDEESEDQ